MQGAHDERLNLGELKMHIVKKIGVERSRKYFYYLTRFVSQKLSKSEFDKTCRRLLGRENISLHNQLMHSSLRNATVGKCPPPVQEASNLTKPVENGFQSRGDGPEQSGTNQNGTVLSNGIFPVSPRKVRTRIRDQKIRGKPSTLGLNGKVEHMLHQSVCREDNRFSVGPENGDLVRLNDQNAACERDGEFLRPAKKQRISNQDQAGLNQEDQAGINRSVGPLIAPLGIPFCSASVGGLPRTVPVSNTAGLASCYDNCGLSNSEVVRKRIENIAVAQGLGEVSVTEFSNTLNNVLDMYLKNLIKSSNDLAGARSTRNKQQNQNKVVNGIWPSNGLRIETPNRPSEIPQDQHSVSLLDFRVAMELNPQQLGGNWPILQERILMRSFEEQDSDV